MFKSKTVFRTFLFLFVFASFFYVNKNTSEAYAFENKTTISSKFQGNEYQLMIPANSGAVSIPSNDGTKVASKYASYDGNAVPGFGGTKGDVYKLKPSLCDSEIHAVTITYKNGARSTWLDSDGNYKYLDVTIKYWITANNKVTYNEAYWRAGKENKDPDTNLLNRRVTKQCKYYITNDGHLFIQNGGKFEYRSMIIDSNGHHKVSGVKTTALVTGQIRCKVTLSSSANVVLSMEDIDTNEWVKFTGLNDNYYLDAERDKSGCTHLYYDSDSGVTATKSSGEQGECIYTNNHRICGYGTNVRSFNIYYKTDSRGTKIGSGLELSKVTYNFKVNNCSKNNTNFKQYVPSMSFSYPYQKGQSNRSATVSTSKAEILVAVDTEVRSDWVTQLTKQGSYVISDSNYLYTTSERLDVPYTYQFDQIKASNDKKHITITIDIKGRYYVDLNQGDNGSTKPNANTTLCFRYGGTRNPIKIQDYFYKNVKLTEKDNRGFFNTNEKTKSASPNCWSVSTGGTVVNNSRATQNQTPEGRVTWTALWNNVTFTFSNPTRTGWNFDGWYNNASFQTKYGDGGANYTVANSFEAYAKWTPHTYYVQYNGNKPSNASNNVENVPSTQTFTYDTSGNLANTTPTLKGWIFEGWNTNANGTGTNYSSGQVVNNLTTINGGTVTLYAKWKPITYYVIYNGNKPSNASSNVGNIPSTQTFTYDTSGSLTNSKPMLLGWIFKGWNTRTDGTGTNYSSGQVVSNLTTTNGANINLYAIWTPITYYVTYNGNKPTRASNNVANIPTKQTCYYDYVYHVQSGATLKGWTFKGWNTKADGSGMYVYANDQIKNWSTTNGANINLYAIWSENHYTIKFDSNYGTPNNISDIYTLYEDAIRLPSFPSRTDYDELGWQILSGADTTEGFTNSTVTDPKVNTTSTRYREGASLKKLTSTNNDVVQFCMIWKHDTPTPMLYEYNQRLANGSTVKVNYNVNGYYTAKNYAYVNTTNPNVPMQNKWTFFQRNWYNIKNYGVSSSKGLQTNNNISIKTTYGTYREQTALFNDKFSMTGDSNYVVKAYITYVDTWKDKRTTVSKEYTQYGYPLTMQGDNTAPTLELTSNGSTVITGESVTDALNSLIALDTTNMFDYNVKLDGFEHQNNASGINTTNSFVKIVNKDNQKSAILTFDDTELIGTYRIRRQNFNSVNIADRVNDGGTGVNNLFNGDFTFVIHLEDNVGNVYEYTDSSGNFSMETEITSYTYNETNRDTDGLPLFKKGESVNLHVKVTGYPSAVKITFPSEWYTKDYPIYLYYGDLEDFDVDSLKPITSNVVYLTNLTSTDTGNWEKDFVFVLPLYANANKEDILVTAYKGNMSGVTIKDAYEIEGDLDNEVTTNKDTVDTNVKVLQRHNYFHISSEGILDDFYTRIQKTY